MAIQIRRGSNAEWETNNSNIVVGEPAVATDSKRAFIGTASGDYMELANLEAIAPKYDSTKSYGVDDYVSYQGKLYVCTVPTSGAWNASAWQVTSLGQALAENQYSNYETYTMSGDIVSFPNGAGGVPVKDLKADVEAIQDLHGYDHPWVGGAGKNLLPNTQGNKTQQGLTYTWNADGGITISGTIATGVTIAGYAFYDNVDILNIGVGTYRLYLTGSGTGYDDIGLQAYVDGVSQINTKNGTFTVPSGATKSYIRLRIPSGTYNVTVYPMMLLGTETDYSFAPYSNICPIGGWSDVNVNVTGKNLLVYPYYHSSRTSNGITFTLNDDGSVTVNGTATSNADFYFRYLNTSKKMAKGTYKYVLNANVSGGAYIHSRTINDSTYINTSVGEPKTFTIGEDDGLYATSLRVQSGTTITNGTFYPMVVVDSETNTSYEPYIGNTYTTVLGQTVYGGRLNVTNGELTITHTAVDLGTLTWSIASSSGNFYTVIDGRRYGSNADGVVGICSNYSFYGNSTSSGLNTNLKNGQFGYYASNTTVMIKDTAYSDTATFKTAMSGVYLVYELATPQTVQLTPQQVRTVLGYNNIWADSGEVEVTYRISNVQ